MKIINNLFAAIGFLSVVLFAIIFCFPEKSKKVFEIITYSVTQSDSIVSDASLVKNEKKEIILGYDTARHFMILCDSLRCRVVELTPKKGYVDIMNHIADTLHLPLITHSNIDSAKKAGYLVKASCFLDLKLKEIDPQNAYLTKPLSDFLDSLSYDFYKQFNKRLTLTSCWRSPEKQLKLAKKNGNATLDGSLHMRGCAADITYKGLSKKEVAWIDKELKKRKRNDIWPSKERYASLSYHIVNFRIQ